MARAKVTLKGDWERELREAVAPQLEDRAREIEAVLADLGAEHQSKPVEDVKPLIVTEFRRREWNIADPQLSEFAAAISEGTTIRVRPAN